MKVPELGENMDALEVDELKSYAVWLRHLANLADYTAQAQKFRLEGRINDAIACEKQATQLYKLLPANWKTW